MMAIREIALGLLTATLAAGRGTGRDCLEQGAARETRTLYLFLTADAPEAPGAARRAVDFVKPSNGAIRLRPVVLLKDFELLKQADERSSFFQAVKELGRLGTLSIPLYDEEALALAERWKVKVVPTFVLVGNRRAHLVSGWGADLKGLLECRE